MAGLFESGFRQTMRDAQRRGITSPDQTPTTFSDVYNATWDVSKVEGVTGGVARRQDQLVLQQMELMAEFDPEFDPMRFVSNAPDLYRVAEVEQSELAIDFFKNNSERIKELSTQHDQEFHTFDDIKARIEKEQAELRAIRDQISKRASPTDRALGGLAGEGQAVMTDPIIAGSMGLGGTARGATAAARIATAMASEAAIIGGIEATMVQPQVYLQKRSINSPYSLVDAGIAVLTAGAGGAAFRGVFQGGASAIQSYRAVRGARTRNETVAQLRNAAQEIAAEDTPGAQTEAQVLNDLADVIESTPSGREIEFVSTFHGTPHTWVSGKPDLSKVGTGGGFQNYGHGIYFVENSDVAKTYLPRDVDADSNLYEVGIPDTEINRMLDWDALVENSDNLSQQIIKDFPKLKDIEEINKGFSDEQVTGRDLYEWLTVKLGGKKQASEYLASKGIPGIKYLEELEPILGRDGQTRNFVVFDEELLNQVKVTEKQRVLIEPDEETQHLANLDQAMDDLAQNRITEVSVDTDPVEYIARSSNIESVDPRTVTVDAKRFQFKAGGDTEGVTDRLKGVEEWDPMRAGISVIYEQADGARFIVDGHQRLALAKRIGDDATLNAIVLRETDGVTVADARQRAAMKNIAEGTGTSLDAAKVFREMGPEALSEMPGLPPQSALVRTARSLAELEQDAFEYVANALKPEQYAMASIVGELIKAGPEQLAAIRALVESNPGTLLQARFIVEQIRAAGFETTETMDLFGGQTISETLFKERARILDNAIKRLKKDKATFRTLVERESEISGAGNVLERQSNLERLGEDEETIQTLSRLANTKGPVSDALNEAARKLKNGERVDRVTRDFLAAARRPADEQRGPGTEVRDAGRAEQEAAPAGNRQEVERATKEYVNDTRTLLPDDPEIDELAAAEARQVADILEQNPDLEIPVEIRVDADGNQITETRKASEVYDDLVEEDTRTTDMFTCMTGGGRG